METKYQHKPNSGSLFVNSYKEKDTQPDYKGKFADESGKVWELAGWKNIDKNGNTYLSIKAEEPRKIEENKPEYSESKGSDKKEFEDQIPF